MLTSRSKSSRSRRDRKWRGLVFLMRTDKPLKAFCIGGALFCLATVHKCRGKSGQFNVDGVKLMKLNGANFEGSVTQPNILM